MPDETNLITGINTEDNTITEGSINYDIRFRALAPISNEMISLIINVEAQGDFSPGYPLLKRAIYYCSRMISAQKGTEFVKDEYGKIKKVYSIWICLSPPDIRSNSITRYSITEENLFGDFKESTVNYDLLSVINVCLGDPDIKENDKLLRLLSVLFAQEWSLEQKKQTLGNEFDITMSSEFEKEVSTMGSLSEGVFNRGLEKGRVEGLERGRVEGLERGRIEGSEAKEFAIIHSVMKKTSWSVEKTLEFLDIPETQRQKYIHLLKQ